MVADESAFSLLTDELSRSKGCMKVLQEDLAIARRAVEVKDEELRSKIDELTSLLVSKQTLECAVSEGENALVASNKFIYKLMAEVDDMQIKAAKAETHRIYLESKLDNNGGRWRTFFPVFLSSSSSSSSSFFFNFFKIFLLP